jgi:hypothetical protein
MVPYFIIYIEFKGLHAISDLFYTPDDNDGEGHIAY